MMKGISALIVPMALILASACASPTSSESIGVAKMLGDATIQLQLVARGSHGEIGDTILTYKPGDPMYETVKKHIGGINPGEEKPVPPWRNDE